nr:family 1 glycosylhydrolase [Motilibacter aurantiacus]
MTGHATRWRDDVGVLLDAGVRTVRWSLRWHRLEPEPGVFDWAEADETLGHLHEVGIDPIVDLVHHTSYPGWLSDGFRDPGFGAAYLRYAEAVARRYPWLRSYTLFNEPFATLFLSGHEALWPPYDRGMEGFRRLLANVLPALCDASQCWADLLPEARHVWVDTAEHHAGAPRDAEYAALANDRRHVALDLVLQHDLDPERPFLRQLLADGGQRLLQLPRARVDVLGLDYYCHSEWWYDGAAHAPSPYPVGFRAIARQYWERYGLPLMLSETNIRGLPTDRASWLRYMLEQYEAAVAEGIPLEGFCWFPTVDSSDWDSLLARAGGRRDPVGVLSLGARGERVATSFTAAWAAAAAGTPAAELPAYRFQEPCSTQLSGLLPQLGHWPWQDPPPGDAVPSVPVPSVPVHTTPVSSEPVQPSIGSPAEEGAAMPVDQARPDLVVLSHLRWGWVWQRPQHLVSRFAGYRAAAGARTWFVEEPMSGDVTEPEIRSVQQGPVTQVWLVVPRRPGQPDFLGFDAEPAEGYGEMLAGWLEDQGVSAPVDVLLYSPMALDVAEALQPARLGYDVMDDLASFLNAPEGLRLRQRRALAEADVVFAGGRSLHAGVTPHRPDAHLFPSGVEAGHYEASRLLREPRERRVAGYVGVIDERIDLELLGRLAAELPDWTLRIVGPVTKIDPAALPQAENLEFPGMAAYDELPQVMAGFDVALMPFALNEATRAISPTKTLEYLAAGLPVVSTRVPDVVADYDGVVHLADDAAEFAAACRHVVEHSRADRDRRLRPIQERHEWDAIASAMYALFDADGARAGAVAQGALA